MPTGRKHEPPELTLADLIQNVEIRDLNAKGAGGSLIMD